jgi:hypothetical protein
VGKRKPSASVVIEPPLPGASDLPEIEGVQPVGVVTKINGSGQRINRAMHIKERVVLLVEASVDDFGHKRTKDGVKRRHTLIVDDMYEVTGDRARELLQEARAEHRKSSPQLSIDDELEDPGPTVTVDGSSGVVMTDKEKAEALAADLSAVDELEAARTARRQTETAPWDVYDTLGVGPIKNRLDHCDDRAVVLHVGTYEAAHKNRSGVMDAVTRRGAQLLAQGTA